MVRSDSGVRGDEIKEGGEGGESGGEVERKAVFKGDLNYCYPYQKKFNEAYIRGDYRGAMRILSEVSIPTGPLEILQHQLLLRIGYEAIAHEVIEMYEREIVRMPGERVEELEREVKDLEREVKDLKGILEIDIAPAEELRKCGLLMKRMGYEKPDEFLEELKRLDQLLRGVRNYKRSR